MPTTDPDNIFYPALSDPYNPVADMGSMAASMQSALKKRANAFSGTDAQRIAYTEDAVQGTLWGNTDGDKKVYQFRNNRWWPEFEFIKMNRIRGEFELTSNSGLYVTSYGRMAQLNLFFEQRSIFDWNPGKANMWKTAVANIPEGYEPDTNISYYTAVWSPQSSRVDALVQIRTDEQAHAQDISGDVILSLEKERFYGLTANRDATFNISATWPLYTT